MAQTLPLNTRLFAHRPNAMRHAQWQADQNGAPVAVLVRDGWYTPCEDPKVLDAIDAGEGRGWQLVALVNPSELSERCPDCGCDSCVCE